MKRIVVTVLVSGFVCFASGSSGQCKNAPAASNSGNSFYNAGLALYSQKNYRAAAQQFEQAITASPSNGYALYYCALCHQQSNNMPRAKQLYEFIVRTLPQSQVAPMAQTALNQIAGAAAINAAAIGAADDSASASVRARSSDPMAGIPDLVRIPFEKRGNDVIVSMQVNGHPAQFILDTGAASIAIGANHLREWGIGAVQPRETFAVGGVGNGTAKGWIQKLDLKLGPIYRREFPCQVQDNMPTDPLLGQTFLRYFNVNIDDGSRMVLLAKRAGKAAADVAHRSYYSKEIPFTRSAGGHMWVDVKVNGKPIKMVFDTGAESTAFAQRDWQALGFSIPDNAQQGISTGVLGQAVSWFFTADSIQLGPIEQNNTPVHVIENSKAPPLLGMSFYGKYKVSVDVNRNVLIFNEP